MSRKGRKNLNRAGDSFFNEHRVEITVEEKRQLENLVRKVNRKREKQIDEWLEKPYTPSGVDTGLKNKDRHAFASDRRFIDDDFILSRRSASLQRFKTREQFDAYIERLEKVTSEGYMEERTAQYQENYITALGNVFGEQSEDVAEYIRSLSPDEFRELVQKDEIREISFIYDPKRAHEKLEAIRHSYGLPSIEDR